MLNNITNLQYSEIFTHISEGKEFCCPVCNNKLSTIPEVVTTGSRPLGLFCPISKDHYLIYAEDADRVNEMRRRMEARRSKKID